MAAEFDLLIEDATALERDGRVSVGIRGGEIVEVAPGDLGDAERTIDAGGGLVGPSFVDPHLHLDKVYTFERAGETSLDRYQAGEMGEAMGAIEAASAVKADYDADRIYANARRAVEAGVAHGVLHHRAFADVDTAAGLEGVEALCRLRDDLAGTVDLTVVAFPQDGVVRDPGAAELVAEAMELGADEVGGIPWIELTEADAERHVEAMFDLAVAHDADVAMLTDDAGDPGLRTTERLAVETLDRGWEGRVTACHARAMETYPEPTFRKLVALLSRAGMCVVSDPQTGPLHARVDDLLVAGVPVSLGQDDVADAYYPFGRNSMLEVAFLAAHLLWKTAAADLRDLYGMITDGAAESLGLADYGLAEGCRADLVVLEADSLYGAFTTQAPPRWVLAGGEVVAETRVDSRVSL